MPRPPIPAGGRLSTARGGELRLTFSDAGVADLARQIERRYVEPTKKAAQDLIEHYGDLLLEAVQGKVPVDTGNLKASCRLVVGELVATVYTDVTYAAFVELGTRATAAQPFMYPAFLEIAPRLFRDLKALLEGGAVQ